MIREQMEKGSCKTRLQGHGDRRKTCESVKHQNRDAVNQRGVSTTVGQDSPSPATRMSPKARTNTDSEEWW